MNLKEKTKQLNCALGLKRNVIGVKFIFDESEYNQFDVNELDGMASYCYMVKLASEGGSFKACNTNFKCNSSAIALGIRPLNNKIISGNQYYSYKTYDSLSRAKGVQREVTYINHKIYGIAIMPLENFHVEPDVVIIIANNYQTMRVVQGYTYSHGVAKNIKLCGNQGVCSECTATPYETNDMNLSMLCSNTRFSCQWDDAEMGIGLPFNKYGSLVDGVLKTINPMELDEKKKEIIKRAKELNVEMDVEVGKNYFNSSIGFIKK